MAKHAILGHEVLKAQQQVLIDSHRHVCEQSLPIHTPFHLRIDGMGFRADPHQVHLADFPFRHNERFFYEYDFRNLWQHVIRVEHRLAWDDMRLYPVCLGRQRATPPEDWGGPWAFMALQDSIPLAISWSATPTYSRVSAQATPTMSGTSCQGWSHCKRVYCTLRKHKASEWSLLWLTHKEVNQATTEVGGTTKALMVLEGLKGKPVAEICTDH
jgi:hypothetical protein